MFEGLSREVLIMQVLLMIVSAFLGVALLTGHPAGAHHESAPSPVIGEDLAQRSGHVDAHLMFVVSSPDGIDRPAAQATAAHVVDELSRSPHVVSVTSPWNASPAIAAKLISEDHTAGLIVAEMSGDQESLQTISENLSARVARDHGDVSVNELLNIRGNP